MVLPVHIGHVQAITLASTYVDELYLVVTWSKRRDTILCEEQGNIKYIPGYVRCNWFGEIFANNPIIKIFQVEDTQGIGDYDWEEGTEKIKKIIGKPIDYVFSAEEANNNIFAHLYPESDHIVLRKEIQFSATFIRQHPYIFKYWDFMPKPVQAYYTKKIALVGTESVGKSKMTADLALIFSTNYVHEVGRDYCIQTKNQLTPELFDDIAMEHALLQKKKINESNKLLFIDSEAVVTQYYLHMYLGQNSSLIEGVIDQQKFDLVLYLEPDVAWVEDEFRFAGDKKVRIENNKLLKKMYIDRNIDFVSISGSSYTERLNLAIEHVKKLLA